MLDVIITAATTAILTTFIAHIFFLRRMMFKAVEEIEKKLDEDLGEAE